ncbi:MAG: LamG-like jellyroll fold domain-containing protein [Bacillota bacterium]|nr:LamG-like jellyroll fold domain-containing protein [Bacillota bacterium]
MRKITRGFISLIIVLTLLLVQVFASFALEVPSNASLVQIAKYTLKNTAVDATGINANMTLKNAPYQTDGSVYSNGIYPYPDETYGSRIQTPLLSSFDFNNFCISFEFKIDSVPTYRKPIIVGGSAYRWIGANVESNGTISLLWNNSNFTTSSTVIPVGTFNTAVIQYNGSVAELYLNGTLACSQSFRLVNGGDSNFLNINYSNGYAFPGYLRNLNVYSTPTLYTVAKYTLNNTAVDSTGKNTNITLKNAPYLTDGSVYSNGIYPYSNTSGSTIQTPYFPSFNFNNFRITFDFKITSIPTYKRPIIIGGSSYRWIGVNVEPNGTISLLWNNSNTTYSATTIPIGVFNTVDLQYNGSVAKLYLNGILACTQNFKPINGQDANFQNVNYSNGTAFLGYLRNLIVYTTPIRTTAKYTLNYTNVDETGKNESILLRNATYQTSGSVYSNGIYMNTDGSIIQTPILKSFNFNNFSVSFDFKIDSLPSFRKPIIVGGSSYRWIGANVEPDGTISLLWNNSQIAYSSKYIPLGQFNNVVIQYNGTVAELYLNGVLARSQNCSLVNGGDANFQNINFSNGTTFLGYLRNLVIS